MIYYVVLLLIFSILDILTLYKQKDKKGIIVYVIFALIALIFGIWFSMNEYGDRLYIMFKKILNLKV